MDDTEFLRLEGERVVRWWDRLKEGERLEAYGLGARDPMPQWMVNSLVVADVQAGTVQASTEPADLPAWVTMPPAVAQLVARRRRGGRHDERRPLD